jgi:hypothetical protein
MLTDLGLFAGLLAALLIYGIIREARSRVHAVGLLILLWRWHSGHTWHGTPITDAGWLRPGQQALTRSGHAPKFHFRPRWQRAAYRCGVSFTMLILFFAWVNYPAATMYLLAAIALTLAALAFWGGWRKLHHRAHRRKWVDPLHVVLAPLVGIPIANGARSWITVERDRSAVVLELPPGFSAESHLRERIASTAAAKLGLEAPEVQWQLAGPEPKLALTASAPPPALVKLDDVMPAIEKARDDEQVWGLGKRARVVKTSLSGDSPHVGLSMGSGAGKSVTARSLLAQLLYHGAIAIILDCKMISHQWAEGLPNVVILRRPHEIHDGLIWLGNEADRRNEVALAGADIDGHVHASVGPRFVVVCEELNATAARLRKYWRSSLGGTGRSPALEALDSVSFMGRQVRINIVYIGQRLSVKAIGGDGDARENIGVLAFGRYSASNWKMLAGDHPMPAKSLTPGRLQVVTSEVTETQSVFMSAREARRLALAGTVSQMPSGMPGARRVTDSTPSQIPGPDQGDVSVTDPVPVTSGPQLVTLSEAVREGLVTRTLAAMRIARHRDGSFPEPAGQRGLAHEYDPVALAEWDRGRQ